MRACFLYGSPRWNKEFGANQSLDCGETERSKDDALRLKDRCFQIGESGEADIKIGGNNQKFFQLVDRPFTDGCLCPGVVHVSLRRRPLW